jgi:two-component system chemotaxis response regulator CheY
VLVVDDSRVVREQVALALRGAGFEVVEASNGAQALALVKELREAQSAAFSLAVCDVNMPVMGGVLLLEALKSGGLLTFPFVILTSEGRPELLARARAAGAKAWMMKPLVADRLLTVVTKLTAPRPA